MGGALGRPEGWCAYGCAVDATARFSSLVAGPESALPLDEAAFLIAAHAYPELDVDAQTVRLDHLAELVVVIIEGLGNRLMD